MDNKEIDTAIAAIPGLSYTATFVPQSQSRNAGNKTPTLNWHIALARSVAATLTTDYTQGIAYVPGYAKWNKLGYRIETVEREKFAAEQGKYSGASMSVFGIGTTLPPPALRDVLHSLLLDAVVLNYSCFEDWARDLGFDPDSRKAETVYRECLRIGLALRSILGDATIIRLGELFQDY